MDERKTPPETAACSRSRRDQSPLSHYCRDKAALPAGSCGVKIRLAHNTGKIIPPDEAHCRDVSDADGYNESRDCEGKLAAAAPFVRPRPNHADRLRNRPG